MESKTSVRYCFLLCGIAFLSLLAFSSLSLAREGDALRVQLQGRGTEAVHKQQFDEAIKYFTKAINLAPFESADYFSRADAYFQSGRPEKAVKDLDTAVNIDWMMQDPRYVELLCEIYTANPDLRQKAKKRYQENIDATGAAWASLILGRIYEIEGRYEDALTALTIGINIYDNKNIPMAYRMALARVEALNGIFDKALADVNILLDEFPTNFAFNLCRAQIYMLAGETDKALAECSDAIDRTPDEIKTSAAIARTREINIDMSGAVRDELFITYDYMKVFAELRALRARIYQSRGRTREAIDDRKEEIALKPTEKAYIAIAKLFLDEDETDTALYYFREALDINARNPEVHMAMARILWVLDMEKEALESINLALEIDPENPYYWSFLADVQYPEFNDSEPRMKAAGFALDRMVREIAGRNFVKAAEYLFMASLGLGYEDSAAVIAAKMGSLCGNDAGFTRLMELIDERLKDDPEDLDMHLLRAMAYIYNGQDAKGYESINVYRKLLTEKGMPHGPAIIFYDIGKDNREIIKIYTELIRDVADRQEKMAMFIDRAYRYEILREYDESIDDLKTALGLAQSEEDRATVRDKLAKVEIMRGGKDDYVKSMTDIIKKDPKDIKAYIRRGDYYLENWELNKAIDDFSKALTLHKGDKRGSDYVWCLRRLGFIYNEMGEYDKGLECLDEVMRLGADANIMSLRVVSYIGLGNYAAALRDLNTIGFADNSYYAFLRGALGLLAADWQGAIDGFSVFLKLEPHMAIPFEDSETRMENAPDLEVAIEFFAEASKKDSGNRAALELLGLCYYLGENYDEALEVYNRLIKSYPACEGLLLSRLGVYMVNDDIVNAQKEFDAISELFASGKVEIEKGNRNKLEDFRRPLEAGPEAEAPAGDEQAGDEMPA